MGSSMEQIIAITLVVSVVILAGIMMTNLFGKMVSKLLPLMKSTCSRLDQNGVEADAVILKMERRGINSTSSHMKMQMHVKPEKGRNFIAEINEPYPRSGPSRYKSGMVVKVKFNPENYKELVLLA